MAASATGPDRCGPCGRSGAAGLGCGRASREPPWQHRGCVLGRCTRRRWLACWRPACSSPPWWSRVARGRGAKPAGGPATSTAGDGRHPCPRRANLGVPVGGADSGVRRPSQLPARPSGRPASKRPAGRLLPDHHPGDRGRLPAGASTGRDAGGRRDLPDPTGSQLRRRCQHAANGLGFALPCPRLLPALSPGAVPPAPCDQRFRCVRGGGFVLEEDGFVVPPGYVGAAGQAHGRLVVAAANRATNHVVACQGQQRLVATVTPHGIGGRLVQCSGSGCTTTACWCAGGSGAWSWWSACSATPSCTSNWR